MCWARDGEIYQMGPSVGTSESLVSVVAESVRALDDGRHVHEVMCRGVAMALTATVAAFARLDTAAGRCTVVCWPQAQEWVALRYATHESWPESMTASCSAGSRPAVWRWRHTLAFAIMRDLVGVMDYAEVALADHPGEDRLIVFARREGWHAHELRLLAACSEPLAAIDNHLLHLEAAGHRSITTYGPLVANVPSASPALAAVLTRREIEVLALLVQGLKARTIAARLRVSPRTINKHLGNVYRKLDAHDRLVAVHKAQALGILPRAPLPTARKVAEVRIPLPGRLSYGSGRTRTG